jgi:hypothetical protein
VWLISSVIGTFGTGCAFSHILYRTQALKTSPSASSVGSDRHDGKWEVGLSKWMAIGRSCAGRRGECDLDSRSWVWTDAAILSCRLPTIAQRETIKSPASLEYDRGYVFPARNELC